jgi:hypothetical protein
MSLEGSGLAWRGPGLDGEAEPLDSAITGVLPTAARGRAWLCWNEAAIGSRKVTYDFARLMDGATQVSCSGFGEVMIDAMD